MAKERLREDLFYRLHVIPIYLPPLRERMEDIPLLVDSFLKEIQLRSEKQVQGISKEVMERFMQYSWPGNIRELINTLEYAFVLCKGDSIGLEHMPESIVDTRKKIFIPGNGAVGDTEKERLIWALNRLRGKEDGSGAHPQGKPADHLEENQKIRDSSREECRC